MIADSAGVRGESVVVRIDGKLRQAASGLPADAVVPIYSITKTLTAICILRLCEAGSIALGDSAAEWLMDVDLPRMVTLTDLLRHTSGLRDYGPLPDYHAAVRTRPREPWNRQRFLDAVLPGGLLFQPGESWSYSNVGYMLLVDILERVAGQPFARIVDDFIVKPLGLRQTFVLEQVADLLQCAPGFGSEVSPDGQIVDVRGRYHPGWCAPRVAASTANETTRVFDALFAGELLQPSTFAEMLTTVPLPGYAHVGAGMGVYSVVSSSHPPVYEHGGGGPGYDLNVRICPKAPAGRVAIAVFIDSSVAPRSRERGEALMAPFMSGTQRTEDTDSPQSH